MMRQYTKHGLMELAKQYRVILRKCAIFNASILALGVFAAATPAMAGDGNEGILVVTKSLGLNLPQAIGVDGADNNVVTYNLSDNVTLGADLGTLTRATATPTTAREFTIAGNRKSVSGENTYAGITVNSGDTLRLKGLRTFKDFLGAAVTNAGTTIVDTVGGLGSVENNGILIFQNVESAVDGNITGTGTINNDVNNLTLSSSTTITQAKLNLINGKNFRAFVSQLNISDAIDLSAGSELTLIGDGINSNVITGTGTTVIDGAITSNSSIGTAITINNGKELTIGAGNVGGAVSNTAGTLNLGAGTLANAITGAGATSIKGDVTANASIANAISIDNGEILTIGASNVGGNINTNDDGQLHLGTGTLNKAVSGTGLARMEGDVVWGSGAGLGNIAILSVGSLDIGTNQITIGDAVINGTVKMEITDMAKDSTVYTGGKLTTGALELYAGSKLSLTIASGLITEKNASTG